MNLHTGPATSYADAETTGAAHDADRTRGAASRRKAAAPGRAAGGAPPAPDVKPSILFDAGSILRPSTKRWHWLVIGALVGGACGVALGWKIWKITYTASAQIVRYEAPLPSDAYRPNPVLGQTLVGMVNSPAIFERLGQKLNPPMEGSAVKALVTPKPERGSDIMNIEVKGPSAEAAVNLANAYIDEVIDFTKSRQREEAEEADANVVRLLRETESDLAAARKELPADLVTPAILSAMEAATPALEVDPRRLRQIQDAQDKLDELLLKYTDEHFLVKAQRKELARLKAELPSGITFEQILERARRTAGGAALRPDGLTKADVATAQSLETAFYKVRQLELLRAQLVMRQRGIEMFKVNPVGNFRPLQRATPDSVEEKNPWIKIGLVGMFFALIGIAVTGAEILRREVFDNHLKTEADVLRVTGLPVLATLGDIKQMSLAQRESWAFRTWIALQDRLAYSPNHGLICGFTSSNSGDGRSTWIHLLASAARKCGFRVLTIATRPTADVYFDPETGEPIPEPSVVGTGGPTAARTAGTNGSAHVNGANGKHAAAPAAAASTRFLSNPADFGHASRAFSGESEFTALTASALFTPAMVTEKLMGPESDPLVHIPLPGWTWNLERRKQWQGALNVWRKIDNVVILVELPPASMPESVLLASNLPNLLWLVQCGKAEATETRSQLETLRHARCNIVGAVINRALTPLTQSRFSRWVGCLATLALLGLGAPPLLAGNLAEPAAAPARAPGGASFSVVSPSQRASWQQKLTLGPGDVLSFNLYGEPQLSVDEVPIGPDGRISYLEANNVMAAGLTVDEFRERLNEELGKYRRAPQVFVTPVTYKSKKYFVLGKVAKRGAYPLDRPITLLEAVGRAGGMETGLTADRGLIELADLSRAFVARGGRQLPVNFEKLFQEGDLSQNVTLEPDDYIYFPGASQQEVFVLGAVLQPGAYLTTQSTGAIGAIAARGGFTTRAWKNKILVLRGGINRPQTFELDALEVLGARKPDLRLEPRDIVYVSERPWIRAEELLDAAATAFVTSAVVTWTGEKVGPIGR